MMQHGPRQERQAGQASNRHREPGAQRGTKGPQLRLTGITALARVDLILSR